MFQSNSIGGICRRHEKATTSQVIELHTEFLYHTDLTDLLVNAKILVKSSKEKRWLVDLEIKKVTIQNPNFKGRLNNNILLVKGQSLVTKVQLLVF